MPKKYFDLYGLMPVMQQSYWKYSTAVVAS